MHPQTARFCWPRKGSCVLWTKGQPALRLFGCMARSQKLASRLSPSLIFGYRGSRRSSENTGDKLPFIVFVWISIRQRFFFYFIFIFTYGFRLVIFFNDEKDNLMFTSWMLNRRFYWEQKKKSYFSFPLPSRVTRVALQAPMIERSQQRLFCKVVYVTHKITYLNKCTKLRRSAIVKMVRKFLLYCQALSFAFPSHG